MWYFAWVLGLGLAVGFGVLNGVWHEFHLFDEGDAPGTDVARTASAGTAPAASAATQAGTTAPERNA